MLPFPDVRGHGVFLYAHEACYKLWKEENDPPTSEICSWHFAEVRFRGSDGSRVTAHPRQGLVRHPPQCAPVKTWGGNGTGHKLCEGCDVTIARKEVEHEVEIEDGRTLRFHVACAGLWQVLRTALPTSRGGQ